jgi:hypothetical protein
MSNLQRANYLKRMAKLNRTELAETSLKLADLFIESNTLQRGDLGRDLNNELYRVLTQVKAWRPHEARFACQQVSKAFQNVRS